MINKKTKALFFIGVVAFYFITAGQKWFDKQQAYKKAGIDAEFIEQLQKTVTEKEQRPVEISLRKVKQEGEEDLVLFVRIKARSTDSDPPDRKILKAYVNDLQERIKSTNITYISTRFIGKEKTESHGTPTRAVLKEECDTKNNGEECTNLSYYLWEYDGPLAMHYAQKGCDLKDSLGCYNVACYHCEKNEPEKALASFKQALAMNLLTIEDWDYKRSLFQDPQLECVRRHKHFAALRQQYQF